MARKGNKKHKLINKNDKKSLFPVEKVRIKKPPKDTYILFMVTSSIEQSLILVLLMKIFSFQSYFCFFIHFIIFKLMVFLITVILDEKFKKFSLAVSWVIAVFLIINSFYFNKIIDHSYSRAQVIYPVSLIITIFCAAIFIILFGLVFKLYLKTLYFRKAFVPSKLYFFIYNTLLSAIFIYLPVIILTLFIVFEYNYIFLLIILSLCFVLFTILLPVLYLKKNYNNQVFIISFLFGFFYRILCLFMFNLTMLFELYITKLEVDEEFKLYLFEKSFYSFNNC